MAPRPRPVEERFWDKVDKRDGCWEWTGARARNGRAVIRVNKHRMVAAARVSWGIANGVPFPEDRFACHTCDNPGCVNPDHIFPGTNRENQLDAIAKGRNPRSAKTHCKWGHPLSGSNIYLWTNSTHTKRLCKSCGRIKAKRYYREGRRYPRGSGD